MSWVGLGQENEPMTTLTHTHAVKQLKSKLELQKRCQTCKYRGTSTRLTIKKSVKMVVCMFYRHVNTSFKHSLLSLSDQSAID
jgi:hypothetical protein